MERGGLERPDHADVLRGSRPPPSLRIRPSHGHPVDAPGAQRGTRRRRHPAARAGRGIRRAAALLRTPGDPAPSLRPRELGPMAQVLRRRGRIQVRVDNREREALLGILDSLGPRLTAPLASAPRAYEEDDLQAEYDRWVRPDIDRGRETDLQMVRDALSAGEDTLPLTEAQALAWLRAFNHLRVAAGEILGIEGDGWEDTATERTKQTPEYGVLIALGYLQEELVVALGS